MDIYASFQMIFNVITTYYKKTTATILVHERGMSAAGVVRIARPGPGLRTGCGWSRIKRLQEAHGRTPLLHR